jgi:hypothetical protein
LVGELAPEVGENTLSWLLVARMAFLAISVAAAIGSVFVRST